MIDVNSQSQFAQADMIRFTLADLTAGVGVAAKTIPSGYVIVGGYVVVSQAFNAATTATLLVGDAGDPDRYTGTPADLSVVGATALDVTGFQYVEPTDLLLQYAQTGAAATEGEGFVTLMFVREGKADCVL